MTAAEPLGLVDLVLRASELRWGRRPEADAARDDLRRRLDQSRLAGLAWLLEEREECGVD
jgi:hypothetical protein